MASYFTGEIVGVKRKAPEVITMVNGYPHVTYPAFDIVGKILWRNLTKDKYEVKVNNSNCILRVSDRDIFKIDYAEESEIFDSILLNDPLSQPYIYLGEFADHVLNKKRETSGFGGFTQLSKKELKYAEADVKATKEVYAMFNKTPKYSVNDIVIIGKDSFDVCGYNVVGVIKDVFNHGVTGEVFYHIIFNSGGLRKVFEKEIETKFNTDKFKNGQLIYKQLLVKMYHTRDHKYLSENEVIAWAYNANLIDVDDAIKAHYSIKEITKIVNNDFGVSGTYTWNLYKKIIFNGPCTIILWTDGSKTIAKTSGGDVFDPEKGVAICFMKKMIGHTETNKILRKASKDFYDEIAREVNRQLDEELRKAAFPLPKGVTFRPFNFNEPIDSNAVVHIDETKKVEDK